MKARRLIVIAVFAALPLVLTASASSGGHYHFDIDSITLSETSSADDNGGGIREDRTIFTLQVRRACSYYLFSFPSPEAYM